MFGPVDCSGSDVAADLLVSGRARTHEPCFVGEHDSLSSVVQLEFGKNKADVSGHRGLGEEPQGRGRTICALDSPVAISTRICALQAWCECAPGPPRLAGSGGGRQPIDEGVQQAPGDAGCRDSVAAGDHPDGGEQVRWGHVLLVIRLRRPAGQRRRTRRGRRWSVGGSRSAAGRNDCRWLRPRRVFVAALHRERIRLVFLATTIKTRPHHLRLRRGRSCQAGHLAPCGSPAAAAAGRQPGPRRWSPRRLQRQAGVDAPTAAPSGPAWEISPKTAVGYAHPGEVRDRRSGYPPVEGGA